jgi:nondiscriminating glutamyl-tRNA synthetase
MNWINHQYIKGLSSDEFIKFVEPFVSTLPSSTLGILTEAQRYAIAALFQEQILFGQQVIELMKPILNPSRTWDEEASSILSLPETQVAIQAFLTELDKTPTLTPDTVKALFKSVQQTTGIKGKPLFMPIRLALTGQLHGVEMASLIPVLGKAITRLRIQSL